MDDAPGNHASSADEAPEDRKAQRATDYQRRLQHIRTLHIIRNRAGGGG